MSVMQRGIGMTTLNLIELVNDSEVLDKIKAVINRDTKQHWLDLGDKEEDINKLTVKQFEELERNQKLNDIKLILRHAEMENK